MGNQYKARPFLVRQNRVKRAVKAGKALPGLLVSLVFSIVVSAQASTDTVQMADGMRSNGKIYVVVAVLLTVLSGLILYLVRLDKKITRLENLAGK